MNLSQVLQITIRHAGVMITTDPNGFAVMAMIPNVMTKVLQPLPDTDAGAVRSDISGKTGCVIYTDMDGSLALTPDELMRLAGLRLTRQEYFELRKKFGIRSPWREDFYDLETGLALQPVKPMPTWGDVQS